MKLVFILVALSIVVLSATKDDSNSNSNFDKVIHVRDAGRKKKHKNKIGKKYKGNVTNKGSENQRPRQACPPLTCPSSSSCPVEEAFKEFKKASNFQMRCNRMDKWNELMLKKFDKRDSFIVGSNVLWNALTFEGPCGDNKTLMDAKSDLRDCGSKAVFKM